MNPLYGNCYTSCGCNRTPHSADWGRNGVICFASCNSVVIYEPNVSGEGGEITQTLHRHKERVNCVRWLKNYTKTPEQEFISVSADHTGILWSLNEKGVYEPEATLVGHTNIISTADGLIRIPQNGKYIPKNSPVLIATASIDSTVRIWQRDGAGALLKCVETINWKSGFCLDVRLTIFPQTDIALLACAADDNNVHLYAEHKQSELTKTQPENAFYKIYVLVGHADWVRSMDFIYDGESLPLGFTLLPKQHYQLAFPTENNNLFLATGSQDTTIRVYKMQRKAHNKNHASRNSVSKGILETEEKILKVSSGCKEYQFSVMLETILAGHEGWIYGVCWHPPLYKARACSVGGGNLETSGCFKTQQMKLLSSSMDKSLIVWSPNSSGIWTEEARLGEVGGNMLGFYGGKFGKNGKSILGHGYQGSFHIWSYDKDNKNWDPKVVVGGHTGAVMDLTWDVKGNYLLSVGSDQTTRLHAPWVRSEGKKITWHEIARPQIHGYDMNCLAMLSEYKFVSGAEEKVIRAFTAPNNFVDNFKRICDIKVDNDDIKAEGLPQGASVPALGLSNKPVFEQMKKEGFLVDDEYPDLYFSPIFLKKPPTEENLMQNTLWPEAQKLYGHGYEIYSLAARNDGVVLASSCKAASSDHAAIILWNAKTWLQIQKLHAHQLTVTQMSFSPNGEYLLSVSRDRRWTLFELNEDGKTYKQAAASDPKNCLHTRVIWCCSWTFDSSAFATGSRDGKIGFWGPVRTKGSVAVNELTHVELPKESITALAFAPILTRNVHILAVGLESGSILLYRYLNKLAERFVTLEGNEAHNLTVKRLAFRPRVGRTGIHEEDNKDNSKVLQLASCGSDHIIKIYNLFLNQM